MPTFNYSTLIDDVCTVIAATWTDVVSDGIWELDEAIRQSWEERTLPYAVFEISPTESAEWGVVNDGQELDVAVHYIATESSGVSTVRTKLEALRSAMWAGSFTSSQGTLLSTRLDWSGQHPINSIAYAKNVPFVAGTVHFRFLACVSIA